MKILIIQNWTLTSEVHENIINNCPFGILLCCHQTKEFRLLMDYIYKIYYHIFYLNLDKMFSILSHQIAYTFLITDWRFKKI